MVKEQKITKTFKELSELDALVGALYAKNRSLEQTKFGYAVKRFFEVNYVPVVRDYNEELKELRVKYALTDKVTNEVLIDAQNPRGFKYGKEDQIKLMKEERALAESYDTKVIEVTPFISGFIPKEATEYDKEQLKGLII